MKSLAELTQEVEPKIRELARKDAQRRFCVKEFTKRLNEERERENEEKIEKYKWENQVSRVEAINVLKKEKDKSKKIWPLYTERIIHFRTVQLEGEELRDLLDRCNEARKDGRSFGKMFNSSLRINR